MRDAFNHETVRPSILNVIGQYLPLRKRGLEFWGICPFHNDKHPSLSVNSDKGLFICRSCGVGGDAITFIEKIEDVDFRTAAKRLGVETYQPSPARRQSGEIAAAWASEQRQKLNVMIAECFWLRDDADEVGAFDLAEYADRQLIMLRGFYDALEYPSGVAELLTVRESIDGITAGAEMSL